MSSPEIHRERKIRLGLRLPITPPSDENGKPDFLGLPFAVWAHGDQKPNWQLINRKWMEKLEKINPETSDTEDIETTHPIVRVEQEIYVAAE